MKRVLKIIKSYYLLESGGTVEVFIVCAIILYGWSLLMCVISGKELIKFVGYGKNVDIMMISRQIIQFICISFLGVININMLQSNKIYITQLPVYKKDLINAQFLVVLVEISASIILLIFLLSLNVYFGIKDYLSGYFGFYTAIYCLGLLLYNIWKVFDVLSIKKYARLVRILLVIYMVVPQLIIALFSFNKEDLISSANAYSGLGETLAPIVKICRYLGGVGGIFLIVALLGITYLLSYKLPLKVSERVG